MGRAGEVGAYEQARPDRLRRQLRERAVEHGRCGRQAVFEAGVAGPQHPGQRLLARRLVAEEGIEAEAVLVGAGRALPCRNAPSTSVASISRSPARGAPACSPDPPARCARARRTPAGPIVVIAASARQAVASEATSPKKARWSRRARRSPSQPPPSARISARSRSARPGSWRERRSRRSASAAEKAALNPTRSARPAKSAVPAREVDPQRPRPPVRSRRPSTLHPPGDPPGQGRTAVGNQIVPAQADTTRPRGDPAQTAATESPG